MMLWISKEFDSLSLKELYTLLKLRAEVFIVEQNCVYNDLDDLDKNAIHLMCFDKEELIAYARLLPGGTRFQSASIGRVITHPSYRGRSLGKDLMRESIRYITSYWKENSVSISAQKHLEKFYFDLGFETISESYLEDGIPHIKMKYLHPKK